MFWHIVPEDLPEIAHVDRLAADGAGHEMVRLMLGRPSVAGASYRRGPRSDSLVTLDVS